jgi:copper resistance protein C
MLTRISAATLGLVAAGVVTTSLQAHPTLKAASPAVDGTVAPPTEIRLSFSEGLILKFSSVELQDQAGKTLTTGKLATGSKDHKQLIVPLQGPLAAGTYTVRWNIVSVDTHRVNGSYSFKVDP